MNPDPRRSDGGFRYTYSAREQAELKRIRETYRAVSEPPAEPDKMARLRALDAGVTRKGTTIALIVGILSSLVMGSGMSLVMTDLRVILGLSTEIALLVGIGTGLFGMVGVIIAYPLYHAIVSRERRRIAPEILRLTAELLDEGNSSD